MASFASRSTGVTAAVRHAISQLPCTPGVYRFLDRHGDVLYIGRGTGLRPRVASHWSDLRGREHPASLVRAIARVEAVACASAHEAAWLERNLLEARMPPWNRSVGGQEAQVFIWMSTGRVRPGLGVSYVCRESAATEYFGPYLGGSRARLAVRGLRRLVPLEFSAGRLRGTAAAMARVRGVTTTGPDAQARQVRAILGREASAVSWAQASLGRLRDRVSEALAFELAAKIQAEIEALVWITSPQRVALNETGDFEVSGWHDGVTVQFGFQAGRLRDWVQQAGPQPPATAMPASPRAELAEFAQQNAELAVRLRHTSSQRPACG